MPSLYGDGDHRRLGGAEPELAYRTPFDRDYGRAIHSPSFRRLQGKTQVFPSHESDFFRNRLTHSLEVAQIAEGIAARLNGEDAELRAAGHCIDLRVCATAALLHDVGHPPFGHNGERALDNLMRGHGGFEGNAQSLRIVTRLEKKMQGADGGRHGLNLTARALAAILKYDRPIPSERLPDAKLVKGYYATEADLVRSLKMAVSGPDGSEKAEWRTIECSIMDLADDIAYSTFDLEDALKAGFLTPIGILSSKDGLLSVVAEAVRKGLGEAFLAEAGKEINEGVVIAVFTDVFDDLVKAEAGTPSGHALEDLVRWYKASDKIVTSGYIRTKLSSQLVKQAIASVELKVDHEYPMLSRAALTNKARLVVEVIKQYVYHATIYSSRVKVPEFRGYEVVEGIFEALSGHRGNLLMPDDVRDEYDAAAADRGARMRIVCDFVAGMTDRYAIEFYGRLHSDTSQSIFKPI